MLLPIRWAGAALLAVGALSACSDSSGPPALGRMLDFQLATRPTAPALRSASAVAGTETIGLGNDTIVLSAVELVLRRIELERVEGTACDSLTSDDDCEDIRSGPVLLDLPLGAGATTSFSVAIDTGTYDKLQFKVHRPESSDDAAFLAQHPDFDGVSIRVTGTYNGVAFTYLGDLNVEQEHELAPPISVTDSTGANLTLFVDLTSWFANAGHTGLISPETANNGGEAENEVKENIQSSLHAFEDDDHDGEDDHGSD